MEWPAMRLPYNSVCLSEIRFHPRNPRLRTRFPFFKSASVRNLRKVDRALRRAMLNVAPKAH